MGMTNDYLNLIAQAGANAIEYIALVDDQLAQIGDRVAMDGEGENPGWAVSNGIARPDKDIEFPIPENTTVRGWRGYSLAEGGTAYGGADFSAQSEEWEHFVNAGTFELKALETGVKHEA